MNEKHGLGLRNYWELHQWSIDNLNDFWVAVWVFTGVVGEREELVSSETPGGGGGELTLRGSCLTTRSRWTRLTQSLSERG